MMSSTTTTITTTTSQQQQQQPSTSTSTSTSTSHSILRILNILQVLLSSIVFVCLMILIISILTSQKTRKQPYNLYLISLEFVDAIMNAMLVVTIIYYWIMLPESFDHNQLINLDPYETSESSIEDDDKTQIQYQHVKLFWIINNSIVIFATTVNMYLSAIVSYHIYNLLQSSFLARQIRPPTTQRIIFESAIVYAFATSIAICYGWSSSLGKSNSTEVEYNKFLMSWGIGISLGIVIPFCFVIYITIRIWKRNLLRLSERRTRTITIYFGRIVFVFIVFYIPGTILFALGVSILENSARWTRMAGTILFSIQGGFSFVVSLTKPDVYEAVIEFLQPRCCNLSNNFNNARRKKKAPFGRQSDINIVDDDGNSGSNNNSNMNNNASTTTTAAAAAAAAAVVVEETATTINNKSNNNHYLVVGQQNNYTRRESVQVQQAANNVPKT